MTAKTKVERLRETGSGFDDLPDNIRIPPLGNCRAEVTKPILLIRDTPLGKHMFLVRS